MSEEQPLSPHQRAVITKRTRTQKSITNAARRLFDERGWYGVTRDDIAREAGVGVATVDNHYGAKRAIALAVYRSELQRIVDETEAAASKGIAANRVLAEYIRHLATAFVDNPTMTIALLPATRDISRRSGRVRPGEIGLVGFDQLTELMSRLLDTH